MTAELVPAVTALTEAQARRLTDEIRATAERTWELLAEAHERRAWEVLGYRSFAKYATAEFGMATSNAYRLLNLARVVRELERTTGAPAKAINASAREGEQLRGREPAIAAAAAQLQTDRPELPAAQAVNEAIKDELSDSRARESDIAPTRKFEQKKAPRQPPERLPSAPDATVSGYVRAVASAPARDLAAVNEADLRAARKAITLAILLKANEDESAAAATCDHPRNKREDLGYAVKCGACGDVVKR